MKCCQCQQSGTTLIEVTAAMLILSVISLALINLFSSASVFTALAARDMEALNRAEQILEEIKAVPNSQRGWVIGSDERTVILENRDGPDYSEGYMLALTDGRGAGQVRQIISFDPVTSTVLVEPAWVTPPTADSSYLILHDKPYRDQLQIINNGDSYSNLQTITVTYFDQVQGSPQELSLTTEKSWR